MTEDILDVAVTHLANDDYNHVPELELRELLADLRGTHAETRLQERADLFILEVRDALGVADRYGPPSLPAEWRDEAPCVDDGPHVPTSNEHGDAWCSRCGERLLIPGYAGGPNQYAGYPPESAGDELERLHRQMSDRGYNLVLTSSETQPDGLIRDRFSVVDESSPRHPYPRCKECGELLGDADRAEVYLNAQTLRANAGGQYVLVDDMPEEAFGPFLVHADPCSRTESGGLPRYELA